MKNNLKILFLLFSLLLLFSSCEKDLYDEPAYQEKYKLEKIPISKLLKNEKFKKTFYKTFKTDYQSKFFANKGIFNRETEGYIITDSVANVASFENNISYNFKIEYPSKPTSDNIFNLVVYEDELGNAENYITKNLEINQILTPVEITDSNDVSKTVLLDCISFHSSPRYFDEYTLGIDWDCVDSYNNTGGGGTGSGNGGIGSGTGSDTGGSGSGIGSGSGSGAGSNSGGPILTSPVGGHATGNSTSITNPCNSLKDKIDPAKANLKPVIDNLKTTLNQPGENGATFHKDENGNFLPPTSLPATTTFSIPMPHGGTIYGNVHTHPYTGSPMFSFKDVFKLAQTYQECIPSNRNEVVMMLVVEYSPGMYETYAIIIDEPVTFFDMVVNAMNSVSNVTTDRERIDALDIDLGDLYMKNTNYERTFLHRFAGFGMSLYKANQDLSKWSKLTCAESDELNPNPQVQSTPCN